MNKRRNKKQAATYKREPIPKKLRFEILKRDDFTCRYCGQSAPDVVLHADHIKPVAKGGTNDPSNLVAACSACNGGKSDMDITPVEPVHGGYWGDVLDSIKRLEKHDEECYNYDLSLYLLKIFNSIGWMKHPQMVDFVKMLSNHAKMMESIHDSYLTDEYRQLWGED